MTLAIGLMSSAAEADPPPPATSALNWTRLPGAESCIGVRDLAAAVEKRIGRSLFVSATEADVLVEGTIQPVSNPRGWRAQIVLTDADAVILGTREIHNKEPSCRSFDESLALVIALMIDPDAVRTTHRKNTPPPPKPVKPPPPRDTRRGPEPLRVKTAAGATLGWGFLPGFGAGMLGRVAFERKGSPGLEIDTRFWPSQKPARDASYEFWSVRGGLSVCPLQGGKVATFLTGCLGTAFAVFHATFSNLEHDQESTGFRMDLTTQARLSRRILGPLLIELGFSLAIPLGQPAFFPSKKIPSIYVAGSADVGISIQFP